MSAFDVARIVPSTRDLAGAVRMQRSGLALLPLLEPRYIEAEVRRLDALDVRALAIREGGEACLLAARATNATPLLLLAAAETTEACQRARFYGADCVSLAAEGFSEHAQTVQSMRMMPAAFVNAVAAARVAEAAGARVMLVQGDLDTLLAVSGAVDRRITLIADPVSEQESVLRQLTGHVDAVVVSSAIHAQDTFASLLDELD